MFITFEGIDSSGKTTQCNRIVEKLQSSGYTVFFVREPGGTEISELIRSLLLDKAHYNMYPETELLLFSAARAQLVREQLIPALKRNEIIVADRFYDSTTAYQGFGRNLEKEHIRIITGFAVDSVRPDATFFLDIPYQESVNRRRRAGMTEDRIEQLDQAFFTRVRDGYFQISQNEPERVHVVDGTTEPGAITEAVTAVLRQVFERNGLPWR